MANCLALSTLCKEHATLLFPTHSASSIQIVSWRTRNAGVFSKSYYAAVVISGHNGPSLMLESNASNVVDEAYQILLNKLQEMVGDRVGLWRETARRMGEGGWEKGGVGVRTEESLV